jgi:predicted GIY-YIG superfamily endonuclease
MGATPDYPRLVVEVLGIRHAPAELARRLIEQALVVEDRHERWRHVGARICRTAPAAPGVYVLRDAEDRTIYVGKAVNLRRRLTAQFADRRWRALHPAMARVTEVECHTVGSEIEALLREAILIRELQPIANVQIGKPALRTRAIPRALVRDVIVLAPSVEVDSVELVAARSDGHVMLQRAKRSSEGLAAIAGGLCECFGIGMGHARAAIELPLAPLVFSWLAGRGNGATRLDPHDAATDDELRARLIVLFSDKALFAERLIPV